MISLRVNKKRTSWDQSWETFVQQEFRNKAGNIDLELSFYRIAPDHVCRVCVEHAVALHLDPRPLIHFSIEGGSEVHQPCEGEYFDFRRANHHEMRFPDANAVGQLAQRLLNHGLERFPISDGDAKAFARSRITANDPEWVAFRSAEPRRATKWGLT